MFDKEDIPIFENNIYFEELKQPETIKFENIIEVVTKWQG